MLEVKHVSQQFNKKMAVNDVSFVLNKGESLGIVGQSGCGKTTMVNMIMKFIEPSTGSILFEDKELKDIKDYYSKVQMVFQNPQNTFDDKKTLRYSINETLKNHHIKNKANLLRQWIDFVNLDEETLNKYPLKVSGGQCQRAALMKAMIISPQLLILDEVTSSLDVIVSYQIIDLIKKIKEETKMTIIFICHDISLVEKLCDDIIVMEDGKIVEKGKTEIVLKNPKHETTKRLIEASYF